MENKGLSKKELGYGWQKERCCRITDTYSQPGTEDQADQDSPTFRNAG